jgi:hypothetical protein
MVMVPTKWSSNAWCLITIPIFLILLWFLWPAETTTTTTLPPVTTVTTRPDITPAPTPAPLPPKVCKIYGDPHVDTFDGVTVDYYAPGEYWIVKSQNVKIQGRYAETRMTNGLSVTKEIAVGGPFIKGHTLIVGSIHAWFDGKPILTTFPGRFSDPAAGVEIVYDAQGEILQQGREGKQLHVIHVSMPDGVKLQINRWNQADEGNYINVKIMMPPMPGMDGDCGNANGNPTDDHRMAVRAPTRMGKNGVAANEMLLMGPKTTPISTPDHPTLADCPSITLTASRKSCQEEQDAYFPKLSCMLHKCFPLQYPSTVIA